jgi:hypothetical protein
MLRIIDMKCSVLHQEFDQEQAVPAATQPASTPPPAGALG